MAKNILLLHCHDLGRFLGAYGVETVRTPHLDRLAEEGVLFEQAFATAPHCSPARASLFTGTYPQDNGVLGLTHEPFGWDLRDPASHIAHQLHDVGYRTELVGVHHESRVMADADVAARLGFDRVRSEGTRDVVVARAIEALDDAATSGQPFYLQVGFTEPHRVPSNSDPVGVMGFLAEGVQADDSRGVTVPSHLRDDEGARAEIAELQGAVAHMDAGVGAILGHLEDAGLADDTVVVFTTDHGLALPGAKCTLTDAGLGVALIVRVPGRSRWSARRIRGLVSHVDVLPTLFELLGIAAPDAVAGTSLVAAVETDRTARDHAFGQLTYHTYFDPKRSVRTDTHRLIVNFSNAPRAMDPTQSWMHRSVPATLAGPTLGTSAMVELYDLAHDADELHNIAGDPSLAAVERDLATSLLQWMRETGDPLLVADAPHTTRRHHDALAYLEQAWLSAEALTPSDSYPIPATRPRT